MTKALWTFAIIVSFFSSVIKLVDSSDDDESEYGCAFTEIAVPCEDHNDKNVDIDLSISTDSEHATLSGTIKLEKELDDTCEIYIDIWKKLDNGKEDPVFSAISGLCVSLKEEDTPWFTFFENIGMKSCPIAVAEYKMNELKLKLSFADAIMNADYVAKYKAQLKITCGLNEFCCFSIGVEIYEIE